MAAPGESLDPFAVQRLLLLRLGQGGDTRLSRGQHFFAADIMSNAKEAGYRVTQRDVMAAVWSLLGQGLAFIDYSQPAPENWSLHLTRAGVAALEDEEANPDDPAGFLVLLAREVPQVSETVMLYVQEAVRAYNNRLPRAAAVMLGVATEAAVLEVAPSLATLLQGRERTGYQDEIQSPRNNYGRKFDAFRKKLEARKSELPEQLRDGIEVHLSGVAELLRTYRNDAGHPTGKPISRDQCFINLRMFVHFAKRLYAIRDSLGRHVDRDE